MTSITSLLNPPMTIALIGLAIVGVCVLGFRMIWWIWNIAGYRLPKPFLGEGSNVEWAELKRAEISANMNSVRQDADEAAERMKGDSQQSEIDVRALNPLTDGGEGHSNEQISISLGSNIGDEVLDSWISETGHSEDAWAERLLGKRPTSKET